MKNIQLLGVILVIIGSFLPLVHIPIIGNWNFWNVDYYLSALCYICCAIALFALFNHRYNLVKWMGIILILLFSFTIFAIRYQASDYFSFLPFKSWKETLSGIVKLKWGWAIEYLGAILMMIAIKSKKEFN